MLDINKLINERENIKSSLLKRGIFENNKKIDLIFNDLVSLDRQIKILKTANQGKEADRNNRNRKIKGKPDEETVSQLKNLSDEIQVNNQKISDLELELKEKLSELPNVVANDVASGGKENNKTLQLFGKQPKFAFQPKDHIQLAVDLGIIDYDRGAKISGSGFWVYKDSGAVLEWALLNYFIDFHRKNKYEFLLLPYLLTEESAYTSGHLPKFRDDLYWTRDDLALNATSEMMLLNYHRDEAFSEKELPKKYFAYSTCFRREGGGYRKEERGMIRGHQFNKIEMFQFTKPEESWKAFDELVKNAETLVKNLGLYFQLVQLAAGDISAAMAKTIDVEVWIPSMQIFKECSSISNALDYQARRGQIKYRNQKLNKNEFVHTLNGSGLATSRLLPAILEQFQQKDGSVKIPKVLQKYTGFAAIKSKKK